MKKFGALRFKSVGLKLFLIIFCSTLLLCSGLGLASYSISKRTITDQVASASSQSIVQASDKLDFLFAGYEAISRQFAVDAVVKSDIATIHDASAGTVKKVAAEDRIRHKLDGVVGSDDRLLGIRLVAKSLVDAESYKSAGLISIRSDEQIQKDLKEIEDAKGNPVWFPVRAKGFFNVAAEPSLTMGRLLRNIQHPELEYYMLIEIKGAALTNILSSLRIGQSGEIRLLTKDGQIVYAKDIALLGQKSYIHTVEDSKKTDEQSFSAEDEDGITQLAVYHPLATAPWTMLGYAPVSDFTKSADKLLYITLSALLAAALIAGLLGMVLVRMIGKPLGNLAKLMEEGERGNLQVRTAFRGRDEIARLGQSFNHMMEQISLIVRKSGSSANEVLTTSELLVEASAQISVHAQEVAGASEQIAGGTADMAEEMDKSNRNVATMGDKIHDVSAINSVMNDSAQKVIGVSEQGAGLMETLVAKSGTALSQMESIQKHTDNLRECMKLIAGILAPMVEINKQTNILALNASIEAVRAGSAGRGFIVIADEIRQLAERSNRSISSVSDITDEVAAEIEGMVRIVGESAPVFQEQIAYVHESSAAFAGVKNEMERFTEQLGQSSDAVAELLSFQRELDASVNSVASVVEETSAATEEVASMSSQQLTVSQELVRLSGLLKGLSDGLKESLILFQGPQSNGETEPTADEPVSANSSGQTETGGSE
ncbi:methyl-accepting chemotaxis protein [Paenibacillus sp. HN-1]|uniref:methyl-accepting chemotaxis protein n=1 Tax=Paenibacillus TaxID=44249 RepID=UPI001CA88495|nr:MULTISPECIES: methyl-accepting chemotaxis protein [Paenibacillus]MBY9080424.1 methyl-accepting chemotaxis protein [Paenibacillus sp. CGMCC 1.18879]MBY9084004.1 methyl-accepting chemotaxis protein [Paenibacillus sinensis]